MADFIGGHFQSRRAKNDSISSRAAMSADPPRRSGGPSPRCAGVATTSAKNGGGVGFGRAVGQAPARRSARPSASAYAANRSRLAMPVALEAIGQHGQVFALEPRRTAASSSGAMLDSGRIVRRQRRLAQHRRQHAGSSIIVSAKLPVKHMPIAPTPGPPHSCVRQPRQRAQPSVTGLDSSAAKARNSALTHARCKIARPPRRRARRRRGRTTTACRR